MCSPSYWQIYKSVTGLYITFIDIYAYFSKNIAHFVFQILVSDTRTYINDFNSVSAWVMTIHPALSFSLHYPLQKLLYWHFLWLPHLLAVFKNIRVDLLLKLSCLLFKKQSASVCSTSYTSSDLLSLLKTASVWVVALTIDTLQYLQN